MDRNLIGGSNRAVDIMSLSARRAWIEITVPPCAGLTGRVALRKESVDRNLCFVALKGQAKPSLSARRAWIEIIGTLLTVSVRKSRSPQGERG